MAAATIAWLGFLLQPCATAAAPPVTSHDGSSIELTLVMHHGPATQCLHCDNSDNVLPGICSSPVASGVPSLQKVVDNGTDSAKTPVLTVSVPVLQQIVYESIALRQADSPPSTVAFTEAYCVYLE